MNRPRTSANLLSELRQVVEQTADTVFVCDRDGIISYVNPAFERLTGFGRREVLGRTPSILKSGLHPQSFYDDMWNTLLKGHVFRGSFINRKKNGELYFEEETITPLTDTDRQVVGFVSTGRDVTEQKRANEELRSSQQRLRVLLDGVRDYAIYMLDTGGHILSANEGARWVTGFPSQEILRKHISCLYPEEDVLRGVPANQLETALQRGRYETNCRLLRHDNSVYWANVVITTLSDPAGHLVGFSKVVRDITERKQTEEALRESEEKFRTLAETAPIGISIYQGLTPRYMNPAATRLFGYTCEELAQSDPLRIIHPAFRETVRERRLARQEGKALPSRYEVQIVTKDGTNRWVEVNASPCFFEGHRAVLSTTTDITERKRVEEALRRSEEKFRSLIERTPYGVYRSTPEGHFLMANPALVKMLGYESEEELLSLDIGTALYHDPSRRLQMMQLYPHQFRGVELQWYRKDGTPITVRLTGQGVEDEKDGKNYYEVVVEDTTQQRILEAQLRQSQKMEAIGRLAGGIAHDFNNLLTLMRGYTELLAGMVKQDHPARSTVEEIQKAADRATSLTQQLLAFSRKHPRQLEILSLNTAVSQIEKMLRRVIGENIELVTRLENGLGRVKAEPGQVEQVILNLAINARDAMPSGGRLVIQTSNESPQQDEVGEIPGVPPGHYVVLTVEDTGVGMDEETQSHIFEPFFTSKPQGKGTGLGLSTVYGIVQQSGGHITVRSQPGRGTTFRLYFPRTTEMPSEEETDAATPCSRTGTETILLVEDEEPLRRLAEDFLTMSGYKVLAAADGPAALRLLEQHPIPVDLLVTDMVMPGLSGRELAAELGRREPGIKVIYISGYTQEELSTEAAELHRKNFLQKPFALDTLAQQIRKLLNE